MINPQEQPFQPDWQNEQALYGPPLGPQSSPLGFMNIPMDPAAALPAEQWTCTKCQSVNAGEFCTNCGQPKEIPPEGVWVCSCGRRNTGKYCPDCGAEQPNT